MSLASRNALKLAVACAVALGCGARTELRSSSSTGSGGAPATVSSTGSSSSMMMSSSSAPLCTSDAECSDGVECTKDVCGPNGCEHQPDDGACSDGRFCTIDVCDIAGGCIHTFSDAVCEDGIACTADTCDAATDSCRHAPCDGMCDDGIFCNGVERCDSTFGCTAGPPTCALGLGCSKDICDEGSKTCTHGGANGCAPNVHLVVTDSGGALRDVNPYTGATKLIAAQANNLVHYDVAILGGRWFAEDPNAFLELTPYTNGIKHVYAPIGLSNSLGAGPDGMLYAADTSVYRVDPDTGAAVIIGQLPPGEMSSGDIAFLGNRMFVSTDGPCGGSLVEVDPVTGSSKLLGGDGLGCVYGLAVAQGVLFVINCDGAIGTFDPDTGVAHVLSTAGVTAYGADTLP